MTTTSGKPHAREDGASKAGKSRAAPASNGRRIRDARLGVTAALAGAVALGIAFGPETGNGGIVAGLDGLHYDADARLNAPADGSQSASGQFVSGKPRGVIVVAGTAIGLYSDFRSIGYRLEDVRNGSFAVPRLFVKAMPEDIGALDSVETRKQVFIKTMLPLILRVNEELRANRARIVELTGRVGEGGVLTDADRAWLDTQYERYGVARGDMETLLKRVDVIPPSLALAQAAEESGWGTSRFALEGRALFGQRTHAEGAGLVPAAYAGESRFKVKSFEALLDGVRSYARNLNTHNAYMEFRKLRADMRRTLRTNAEFNSLRLAEALTAYSERGRDYVETIKSIIRVNDLRQLDDARLSNDTIPKLTRSGA